MSGEDDIFGNYEATLEAEAAAARGAHERMRGMQAQEVVGRAEKAEALLVQRQRAYQLAAPALQIVLRDLMQFCRLLEEENEDKTPDTNRLLILTGRRQVWLRIERHLKLKTEDLFALYSGAPFKPPGDGNE